MSVVLPRALRELHARHASGLKPIWDPRTGLTVEIRVPAATALYPERTRCKRCRSGLDDLVVLRMFCSYKCAGLPAPDKNPSTAPRVCKRAARSDEKGEWAFKQKFTHPQDAARFLREGTTLYRCSNCFFLHIGNVSAPPSSHVPVASPTGKGKFADAVAAVLHARGQDPTKAAAVAAAKRDVRAVFEVLGIKPK